MDRILSDTSAAAIVGERTPQSRTVILMMPNALVVLAKITYILRPPMPGWLVFESHPNDTRRAHRFVE